CGNILVDGTCSKCNSGAGNSFVYDPNPKSFNEVQRFLIYLRNPITIYTCVRYVKAIPTMVMNVRNECRLSMSQNRAAIKALIDSLLDEFVGELIFLKSISSGIDEADCDPEEEIRLIEKFLYDNSSPRPLKEFISENSDAAIKSFFPSPIPVEDSDSLRDEIDLSLTPDDSLPPSIEDDDYDSEGDILEELISNDSFSISKNESFHFDIPSSPCPLVKPPDDEIEPNLGILTVKVEKSPHLLSHQGLKAFQLLSKSRMMIYEGNIPILDVPFLHFYSP
nr:hypothetical protein [Tanacetum cinerariifolium]